MKRSIIVLILIGLNLSAFAMSEHGMGNGGNALVCYSDKSRQIIKSISLFDYWEHDESLKNNLKRLSRSSKLSVKNEIDRVIQRIRKYQPSLAEDVERTAIGLLTNINHFLISSKVIPKINDFTSKMTPNNVNCFIEQFAVQWKNPKTGERRFFISKELYNSDKISNADRAGIILHEAIYRYAVLHGANNSDGIRYYNYMMSTDKFDNENYLSMDYLKVLKDSHLNVDNCQMDSNGIIGRTKKFNSDSPILFRTKGYACVSSQIHFTNGHSIVFNEEYYSEKANQQCRTANAVLNVNLGQVKHSVCVGAYSDSNVDSYYTIHLAKEDLTNAKSGLLLMKGPVGLNFDCTFAEKILVDKSTGEIIECSAYLSPSKISLTDNGKVTHFVTIHKNSLLDVYVGSVSPLSPNKTFKLLNDEFKLDVEVQTYTQNDANEIVINADNFLIGGKIMNDKENVNDFLKTDDKSPSALNNNLRSKNYKKIIDIKHHNLKILADFRHMSDKAYNDAGLAICAKYIASPKGFLVDSELIDVWGTEAFYEMNLVTQKTFTDEQVRIISAIKCY